MSDTKDNNKAKSILSEIFSFFTSVQTALSLLFVLAAASVVGTLIPQTQTPEPGKSMFLHQLALILDLHNIFRSWWFIIILVLLACNLLGCLIQRLPKILEEWRGPSDKALVNYSLKSDKPADELSAALDKAASQLMGSSPRIDTTADGRKRVWVKHKVYLLGFPFLHSAIILILVGGLLGLLFGIRGHVMIKEGESDNKFFLTSGQPKALPFQIAVDAFTLTRYPSGEPKEYRSDIRLLENGLDTAKAAVRVNHPFTHKGFSIYQSDYKVTGVKEVKISYSGADGVEKELTLRPRAKVALPETDFQLQLHSFDPGGTKLGPGAEIIATSPNEKPGTFSLYRNSQPETLGNIKLRFVDYSPSYATGLQIGSDPGAPFVWTGCVILITGFMLVLFTNYRRLTVEVSERDGKSEIRIRGSSRRMRPEFRQSVEQKLLTLVR
jgi:cytochrome c biogenesis protein